MSESQKARYFSRTPLAAALLAPALVLTGCFLDGDDGHSGNSGSGTSTASGLAYDGYLVNAKVCVDLNLNKTCDSGEPQGTTGTNGQFNITGLTDTQKKYPIVLESIAGLTYDVDDGPGVFLGAGLKFLAPAGSKTVSAFSTIIQAKIEAKLAGGDTRTLAQLKAEAASELATSLGLSGVNLTNYDPIAIKTGSGTEAEKIAAAKLHLINQILSNELLTNLPGIITQADGAGVSSGAAASLLAEKLDSVITTIKAEVDAATSGLADAAAISALDETSVTISVLPITVTDAELQAQQAEEEAAIQAIQDQLGDSSGTGGTGATGGTGGTI